MVVGSTREQGGGGPGRRPCDVIRQYPGIEQVVLLGRGLVARPKIDRGRSPFRVGPWTVQGHPLRDMPSVVFLGGERLIKGCKVQPARPPIWGRGSVGFSSPRECHLLQYARLAVSYDILEFISVRRQLIKGGQKR